MIIRGITVAAIFASALAFGACSMLVDKNTHDYPQGAKDSFMKSCMSSSGGQEAACTCMLGKVQQKYTYGQVEELEKQIQKGEPSAEFNQFMTEARDQCVTATKN